MPETASVVQGFDVRSPWGKPIVLLRNAAAIGHDTGCVPQKTCMSANDTPAAVAARDRNRTFYDRLWCAARLIRPERFNTWRYLAHLADPLIARLELGPGLRPRLPIEGTDFVDLSQPAVDILSAAGGRAWCTTVECLPFADACFDAVLALDVIEHTVNGDDTLAEIARVARPGAEVWISVPLNADDWRPFDDMVGHCHRYDAGQLKALLERRGFTLDASAMYGMKPTAPRLVDWSMKQLARRPDRAMWFYNRFFMPIGLRRQKPLIFHDGLMDTDGIGEILLRCRRHSSAGARDLEKYREYNTSAQPA
jgi:SAM-dependent methyltransferase